MKNLKRGRKRLFLTLAIGLALLLAAAPFVGLKLLDRQIEATLEDMDDPDAFQVWMTEPVHLPPGALEVTTFSTETLDLRSAFLDEWGRLEKELGQSGATGLKSTLDDSDSAEFTTSLALCASLGDLYEEIVLRPDYDMDVWDSHPDRDRQGAAPPAERWVAVMTGHRILSARTRRDSDHGRHREALNRLEPMLRSSLCHQYCSLIKKALAAACLKSTLKTCEAMLAETADQQRQTAIREVIGAYRESLQCIQFPKGIDPLTLDHVGMIRSSPHATANADLTNMTGFEWMTTTMAEMASASANADNSPEAEKAVAESARLSAALRDPSWQNAFQRKVGTVNAATLYAIAAPGLTKMQGIIDEALQLYDDVLDPVGGDGGQQALR